MIRHALVACALLGASTASAGTVDIDVADSLFSPSDAVVTYGDIVFWTWVGSAPHSTTAAAGQALSWDSGVMEVGEYKKLFNEIGSFNYYCSIHGGDLGGGAVSGMSGTVHVQAPVDEGIVINEVLADPDGILGDANCDGVVSTTQDEFVEIVNTGSESFDLSGGTISDEFGVRHVFPADTLLQPNGAVVVFGGGAPTFDGSGLDDWCGPLDGSVYIQTASTGITGFNNGGDTVVLTNEAGTVLDALRYGSEGGENVSVVRSPELDHFGGHVKHPDLMEGAGIWSPGTLADGAPFLPPAPTLAVTPGTAGVNNTFSARNVEPGANVIFVYGTAPGSFAVPPCPGVNLDIASPKKVGNATADASGEAVYERVLPAGPAGNTVYWQAVATPSCEVTNMLMQEL